MKSQLYWLLTVSSARSSAFCDWKCLSQVAERVGRSQSPGHKRDGAFSVRLFRNQSQTEKESPSLIIIDNSLV